MQTVQMHGEAQEHPEAQHTSEIFVLTLLEVTIFRFAHFGLAD
jgi:hypothetical protein